MNPISAHVVQTSEWGSFKSSYGTKSVRVGDIQYTLHKIPFTNYFVAYSPKVNPFKINFAQLADSLAKNNAVCVNFDVPNVLRNSDSYGSATELFVSNNCGKSPKDTFAKYNVLLDLTPTTDALLAKMHKKHRYNISRAEKASLEVRIDGASAFDDFYTLHKSTADRQKYYTHPKKYFELIWKIIGGAKIAHFITVLHENVPLASWMLFVYDGVLYYPYGGSSDQHKNLYASNLIGWEAIKFGKLQGCHTFDMWGACKDPNDSSDPWWGFTNFKLKFGGTHVEYMDSFDFVVNKPIYNAFILANDLRWKLLNAMKGN